MYSGGAIVYKKLDKKEFLDSLKEVEPILKNPYKCGFVDWD